MTATPTVTASVAKKRGFVEPQPLPRRVDLVSVPAPAGVEARRGDREDPGSSSMIDRLPDIWGGVSPRCGGFKGVRGRSPGRTPTGLGARERRGFILAQDGTVWTTDKDGLILWLAGRRDDRQSSIAIRVRSMPT